MAQGPGGIWIPDANPLLGMAQTVGQLQQNALYPLERERMQLQNRGLGISNDTNQNTLQNAYATGLRETIASVPKTPDDPTGYEARVRAAVQRNAGSLYPQQMADSWFGGVDVGGATSLRDLADQATLQSGNEPELRAHGFAPATPVDTGGGTQFVRQGIGPDGATVDKVDGNAGYVSNTQSPETMGGYVSIKRNDGSTISVPRSTLETSEGRGIPNVAGPDGQPLTGAHGEVLGALPAGQEGALASNVQNQQDRANTLQTAFEGSAQRKALLQELAQTNGEFRSGPGAAKWANIVTEFNRVMGTDFKADKASSQQVFGKIAGMIAAQQRDTLGLPATNAGQSAAEIAAPNSAYSTEANQALIGQLTGNEDLLQTKQSAWTKFHKAGGDYNDFVTQFNRNFDPRFYWDQYTPANQQATHGMTDAQKAEYERRKKRAMSAQF